MYTHKGKTGLSPRAKGPKYVADRFRRAAGLLLLLTVCACANAPSYENLGVSCEAHGVKEQKRPMASQVQVQPLYHDELIRACAPVQRALSRVHVRAEVAGCLIPKADGTALAFYRAGDNCAMRHELCHALHGPEHTDRYQADLARGVTLPYCPPNPLMLAGR